MNLSFNSCDKYHSQSSLGIKRFISIYSLQSVKNSGTWRQEQLWRNTVAGLHPKACSACFLLHPRTTCSRGAPGDLGPPTSIISQKVLPQTVTDQSVGDIFTTDVNKYQPALGVRRKQLDPFDIRLPLSHLVCSNLDDSPGDLVEY